MNFASVHRLPVIFICENNGYAISVPLSAQMAVDSVASRAAGYGMPGVSVDGMDAAAVYEATAAAAERARSGAGPTLIEARVERFRPAHRGRRRPALPRGGGAGRAALPRPGGRT